MATGFRVSTFNVENLLHPGVYFSGRPDDAPYDEARFNEKVRWIASVLDEGRPDVIGFQEVFSFEAIQRTIAASKYVSGATIVAPGIEAGQNIAPGVGGRPEAKGPNVALASRFPVLSAESIAEFPASIDLSIPFEQHGVVTKIEHIDVKRFERPVLKARVMLPGDIPATVLVAHLKSKRPKFLPGEDAKDPVVQALGRIRSLMVRAMEAVALRAIVVKLLDNVVDGERGEPLMLFGDLNDDLTSVTTQAVAGEEPWRFAKLPDKLKEWDLQLYSVHDIQEAQSYRDVSYTHIYNGRYELLDHIFVSQEFVRQFPNRIAQVANTRIFNDHLQDDRLLIEPAPAGVRTDHGIPVTEIELVKPAAAPVADTTLIA